MSADPELLPFKLKKWHTGHSSSGERSRQFRFSTLLYFRVRNQYGTDRRTDGRMERRDS